MGDVEVTYEYTVQFFSFSEREELSVWLNSKGAAGWMLANVTAKDNGYLVIMEKMTVEPLPLPEPRFQPDGITTAGGPS